MPRQPKLGKQKDKRYTYWGATIGGKRMRFGRVDQVEWVVANNAFLKVLVGHAPQPPEKPSGESGSITVEELCADHCKWHGSQNAARTASNRIGFLDRWCSHTFQGQSVGGMLARDVTKETLADFMQPMKAGWTAWNYCVAVKAAFNWAFREGIVPFNHLSRYPNPPQPKADVSEATLITKEEVAWFLAKSEAYGAANLLRVLYATGARPGELCSALVSDYISSAKQLRLLNWKNDRKTQVARRIPIPTEAAAIVSMLCKGRKGSEAIFTGPNGAKWTPNRLQKIWRKIRDGEWRAKSGGKFEQLTKEVSNNRKKKSAQRDSLSLYDFRHLWISDALQQGVPIATIAKMAGTSIKMIERTYGHFRNDDLGKVAEEIANKRSSVK